MNKKLVISNCNDSDYEISPFNRSKILIKTAIKLGSKKAKHKLKKNLAGNSTDNSSSSCSEDEIEIAETLFRGLCQLRGTALKLAQYLSSLNDILKPEHIEVLSQSHYQVPPLNFTIISKVIRNEFKKEIEEIFIEFNTQAMAAASLGQVHRAKIQNDTGLKDVIVKIQYPGIDQTISIDLSIIKKITSATPKNGLILNSINSIESRLREEVDYSIERENAELFSQFFFDNENFVIPKVYPDYSTNKVLTYDFIDGKSIKDWINTNPCQEFRNKIAQQLWCFTYDSLFRHKVLHCDPNIGNFLILNNLKLAILDFGCVQKLSTETVELLKLLWDYDQDDSKQKILSSYLKLGVNLNDRNPEALNIFYQKTIQPYKGWLNKFSNSKSFNFNDYPNFSLEGQKILFKELFNNSMKSFSPEFTLIHRTLFGIFKILEDLKAEIII